MYEELVERLRFLAKQGKRYGMAVVSFQEAADAIEELQKVANKLLAKYQEEATAVIWEYSGNIDKSIDILNEEVRTLMAQINGMPRPQPPKEKTE